MTDTHHSAQLIFVFLVETGFYHVGEADLKLLCPSDPLTLATQSAGITDTSHHAWARVTLDSGGKSHEKFLKSSSS